MDGYMTILAWTLTHRWTTVVGGILSPSSRRSSLFMTLPADLPADHGSGPLDRHDRDGARLDLSADRRGRPTRSRPCFASSPRWSCCSPHCRRQRQNQHPPEGGARAHERRVRARFRPAPQPDPRRAYQLPLPVRRRPRHHAHSRRRRSRPAAPGVANQLVEEMAASPRDRRASRQRRPAAAGNHDHAAARSRRRSRRDHRGAEPGDPHRHPGRYRPEQRPILAVRSPDPDPGVARTRTRGSACRRSRICRCRPRPAARCR